MSADGQGGQAGSALARETTGDGLADVDAIGTTWRVPTRRHLKHFVALNSGMSSGAASVFVIARTFLDPAVSAQNQQKPDQWEALLDLDPSEENLAELTDKIGGALGLGDAGN